MAKENGDYGWKKQKTVELKCPSGAVAFVHRPGPDIGLRSGRVAEFFQALDPSDQEAMWDKLETMSDVEAERIKKFVREVVLATIVSPKVYANPVGEQLGLDDIPVGDFWHIFNWGSSGGRTQPVKVGEGEVTVEAVDNFPQGQDADAVAVADSQDVQPAPVSVSADPRRGRGAGV